MVRFSVVMRALVFFAVAVMACATEAQAQSSWIYVIDGTDHITGLNNNSRTKVGAYYRAWFVRVVKVRELGYDYTLMHYEADCSANRMRRLAFAAYKLDGSNEFGSSEIEPWEAIFPESIAEAMKDEVCNPALLEEPGFDNAKAFAQWGRASLLAD